MVSLDLPSEGSLNGELSSSFEVLSYTDSARKISFSKDRILLNFSAFFILHSVRVRVTDGQSFYFLIAKRQTLLEGLNFR